MIRRIVLGVGVLLVAGFGVRAAIASSPATVEGFQRLTVGDREYVVPAAERRSLSPGRVDPARFQVSGSPLPAAKAARSAEVTVTFTFRDRSGAAPAFAMASLLGVDNDGFAFVFPDGDGTATVTLPPGTYLADYTVDENDASTVLVDPALVISDGATIGVDARAGRLVSVSIPDSSAEPQSLAGFRRDLARGPVSIVHGNRILYTAHLGAASAGFETFAGMVFARPGPSGTVDDSPLVYATAWTQTGRFYTGLTRRVTSFATVRAQHGSVGPGRVATKSTLVALGASRLGSHVDYLKLPFSREEKYAGTALWANQYREFAPDRSNDLVQSSAPVSYVAGRHYTEQWNSGPFVPALELQASGSSVATFASLWGDSGGHFGTSMAATGSVSLYRNGSLVGSAPFLEGAEFEVGSSPGRYRLEATGTQSFTEYGSSVSATWEFSSFAAPMPTVRFGPGFTVSVPDGRVRSVHASYDGGTSWEPVRVSGGVAHVRRVPGLVSLRAVGVDKRGSVVTQTVVNAYRFP